MKVIRDFYPLHALQTLNTDPIFPSSLKHSKKPNPNPNPNP
jgi:hypothetical protein